MRAGSGLPYCWIRSFIKNKSNPFPEKIYLIEGEWVNNVYAKSPKHPNSAYPSSF